jgi:transposase
MDNVGSGIRGQNTGPNPTDRSKSGTQIVLVSSADDLPLGIALCPANRQDATYTQQALQNMVIEPPLQPMPAPAAVGWQVDSDYQPADPEPITVERPESGRLNRTLIGQLEAELHRGVDRRALPYLRGDCTFAKVPAYAGAKREGYRMWAPDKNAGQSRRGLGTVRLAVERTHALINQFGRIFRRLDRIAGRYLAWVQLACCLIYLRRGFFP